MLGKNDGKISCLTLLEVSVNICAALSPPARDLHTVVILSSSSNQPPDPLVRTHSSTQW